MLVPPASGVCQTSQRSHPPSSRRLGQHERHVVAAAEVGLLEGNLQAAGELARHVVRHRIPRREGRAQDAVGGELLRDLRRRKNGARAGDGEEAEGDRERFHGIHPRRATVFRPAASRHARYMPSLLNGMTTRPRRSTAISPPSPPRRATVSRLGGDGGLIAIDRRGRIGMPFNSEGMYRACLDAAGRRTVALLG
jgi:hypothetical protein